MIIKPKMNYKMLGTDLELDSSKTYFAIDATNQPNWRKEGKIFVIIPDKYHGDSSFLLEKGEYKKVGKEKLEKVV